MPRPTPETEKPRRRRLAGRIVIAVGGFLLGGIAAVFYTALRTPSWYQPPIVAEAEQQSIRNNLVQAEQAFTQSLLAGNPFVYHIYQDDLNRWVAMRREIYPRIDELVEPVLTDPFTLIAPGLITIAGRIDRGALSGIVSLDLEPAFRDERIVLTAKALRCGGLRLPLTMDAVPLDHEIELHEGAVWPGSPPMKGSLALGLSIDSRAWWRNGGIDYEVTHVAAVEGRLDLTIRPLGHHASRRSNQDSESAPDAD